MKAKKILFFIFFTLITLLLLTTKSNASLYLNNLDFNAKINSDGSMDVTETWDIDISDTNTLYKTFKQNSARYSGITNVVVTESGGKELLSSDAWSYHMQKGYYYGGYNLEGMFEICWGVGLENDSARKTYKISYTVNDAIAKYNDVAELYWQFVGSDFEVDAKKITGTIKLPTKANSKEDIKVWGHVETLNGEIYATSEDTVEFSLNNFYGGRYVEIRVAFPTDLVAYSNRTYNTEQLQNIIEEETVWANEANERREKQQKREKMINTARTAIGYVVSALLLVNIFKLIKDSKNITKLVPTQELEYYREKPDNNSTPADALFLYNNGTGINTSFGNIFSATLLNLSLKGYFKIEVEPGNKKKDDVYITILKDISDLKYEEAKVAKYVKKALGGETRISIKELQKYIKRHPEGVSLLIEGTEKATLNKNKENRKYDEKTAKAKSKYNGIAAGYIFLAVLAFVFLRFWPVSLLFIVDAIIAISIDKKLSRLSQEGIDEREKWKGLKKYMEDFSLLNEKEVPALTVWEEFLVYATAFGIADKVIKQLKLVYPDIENMDNFNTASYVYLMSHTNFNSSFSNAINSSISSTMSSGSGGGGGFSGGGGGGRRWWPEAAEDR